MSNSTTAQDLGHNTITHQDAIKTLTLQLDRAMSIIVVMQSPFRLKEVDSNTLHGCLFAAEEALTKMQKVLKDLNLYQLSLGAERAAAVQEMERADQASTPAIIKKKLTKMEVIDEVSINMAQSEALTTMLLDHDTLETAGHDNLHSYVNFIAEYQKKTSEALNQLHYLI